MLLPIIERVLGTDHPDTMAIRQIVICLDGSRGGLILPRRVKAAPPAADS
jgi:hypothetical protein